MLGRAAKGLTRPTTKPVDTASSAPGRPACVIPRSTAVVGGFVRNRCAPRADESAGLWLACPFVQAWPAYPSGEAAKRRRRQGRPRAARITLLAIGGVRSGPARRGRPGQLVLVPCWNASGIWMPSGSDPRASEARPTTWAISCWPLTSWPGDLCCAGRGTLGRRFRTGRRARHAVVSPGHYRRDDRASTGPGRCLHRPEPPLPGSVRPGMMGGWGEGDLAEVAHGSDVLATRSRPG